VEYVGRGLAPPVVRRGGPLGPPDEQRIRVAAALSLMAADCKIRTVGEPRAFRMSGTSRSRLKRGGWAADKSMDVFDFFTKTLPSIALIAGGGWAAFNWYVTERRRKAREIPSLDGTISTSLLGVEAQRVVATITSNWRNPGVEPVSLDPRTTFVDVFDGSQVPPIGPVDVDRGFGPPLFRCLPLADASLYILEPGTNSELTCHCVVTPGRLYFIRWVLSEASGNAREGYTWSRETWLDTRAVEPARSLQDRPDGLAPGAGQPAVAAN